MGHQASSETTSVALFWDQSLIWGIICWKTLKTLGIPFHLLSSDDIKRGLLSNYRVLVIPGGWTVHKVHSLGAKGREALLDFILKGGSYLGLCGGAGLALEGISSLGLVPVRRLPPSKRLPNISGRVYIEARNNHSAWQGLPSVLPTSIWWPSQFEWNNYPREWQVASYKEVGKDCWIADLHLLDLDRKTTPWKQWETFYGIKLDPSYLLGQPAILEIPLGKGRLLLSYPHLDTPGDKWGNFLFKNLLNYLRNISNKQNHTRPSNDFLKIPYPFCKPPSAQALKQLKKGLQLISELIEFGHKHLLWNWRTPWLLSWKRGVRGLEYGTLAVTISFLYHQLESLQQYNSKPDCPWLEATTRLTQELGGFCKHAKRLLIEEKVASQTGPLPKIGSVNPVVDSLRTKLFGAHIHHGGRCQLILDHIDRLLLYALRLKQSSSLP